MRWAAVGEYRAMLDRGLAQVRAQAAAGLTTETHAALREYRRLYGILDAMTPAERAAPLDRVDSGRMRRIARGAGVTDREVLSFLIAFHGFIELEARAEFRRRRQPTS